MKEIINQLFEMQDMEYREFQAKLMPTVDKETIIGIRTPVLRAFAKRLAKEQPELVADFLKELPHKYYEENNLHGFLLENAKDYSICIKQIDAFLPYVDNWATCDSISPKVFKKHLVELEVDVMRWMHSEETYTIRYGIGMLMRHFLDEAFKPQYLENVCKVQSEEYYVNMMRAWYFATALAKQWESTVPFIEEKKLDVWTHNKSIQKSIESFRITKDKKDYLREYRIKDKK